MKGEIYKVGDTVFHDTFGYGLVIDKFKNKSGKRVIKVKFLSLETERNIVADFYGIKKVRLSGEIADKFVNYVKSNRKLLLRLV